MKKILALSFFIFLLMARLFALDSGYKILKYEFYGKINLDNSVDCREIIKVDFKEESHGIYRDIPLSYEINQEVQGIEEQLYYRTKVKNFSAGKDSVRNCSTRKIASYRIGNLNSLLTGQHIYDISYCYMMPGDGIKDKDFFFFSPLGSMWETGIDVFSFDLEFPEELSSDCEIELYSGPFGSADNLLDVTMVQEGNHVKGYAYNIPERNAVTLYAELPENYFCQSKIDFPYLPFFFLLALIFSAVFTIFMMGSNPKVIPTVEFYPPEGITSGEIGYIIDGVVDEEDVWSLIFSFATKGYLKIVEKEKKADKKNPEEKTKYLRLEKLRNIDENAKDYEKEFFYYLFKNYNHRDLMELGDSYENELSQLKKKIEGQFKNEKKLYSSRKGTSLVLMDLFLGLFIATSNKIGGFEFLIEGIVFSAIIFSVSIFRFDFIQKKYFKRKTGIVIRIVSMTLVVLFLFGGVLVISEESKLPSVLFYFAVYGVLLINFNSYRLNTLTKYGAELTGKLLGLKKFIKEAELPKLKLLVDENPQYFFDILPYAMLFGLCEEWGKHFNSFQTDEPDWYEHSKKSAFTTTQFSKNVQQRLYKALEKNRYSADSASTKYYGSSYHSSSSRGYSGGGGGGGGGRRW